MSEIRFSFNGMSLTCVEGTTVAAALLAHGVNAWRTTRHEGSPRGIFCGIGQCFDCLVTINGQSDIRACLDLVRDGDVIVTQVGHPHA